MFDIENSCSGVIRSQAIPVIFAGAQPAFPGLDHVNLLLPASLKGTGTVNVNLTVDGMTSNTAALTFQ